MSKQALIRLTWSSQAERYEVQVSGEPAAFPMIGESQAWFAWLDAVSSFSFHSRSGRTCTVRKERVQRGNAYWYAYRRTSEKIVKRYLGRSASLTISRLEEIAA